MDGAEQVPEARVAVADVGMAVEAGGAGLLLAEFSHFLSYLHLLQVPLGWLRQSRSIAVSTRL